MDIQIKHPADQYQYKGFIYNCDNEPLAMPAHFKIGNEFKSYADKVDAYADHLMNAVTEGNQEIMEALEEIFQQAQQRPVYLLTACCPEPYVTHAHKIRNLIERLSNGTD